LSQRPKPFLSEAVGLKLSECLFDQFKFLLPATINDPSLIGRQIADRLQRKCCMDTVPNRSISAGFNLRHLPFKIEASETSSVPARC
jgi:hypothetical protein